MDILVQIILPYIITYKYVALFIFTFLASFILPIPAGTLLIASSAFASQGYFNIYLILLVVIMANILGDNLSYLVARLYGKQVLSKIPFTKTILNSKNFILIEKNISNHPGLIIIISRFEVLSTLTINFICGLGKASYKKFLKYEIIGALLSILFYAILGYSFGDNWKTINKIMGEFSILFFFIIILGISIFWKKILLKLNRNKI
ncbi:MAG: DedA family protein [Candidatus Paceibacterota bacterium]